jgi:hypothetical protein
MTRRTLQPKAARRTPVKAVYKIPELAELAGVDRHMMRRLLDRNGVTLERIGTDFIVYLSHIRVAMPDLYDSIALTRSGGSVADDVA